MRKETDAERAECQSRIHALRASEATLTAQLRARDEALRVAKEALESWLSEEGDVADALEKSESALAAIEEALK